jgi:redox-sensitive bicupin YhaK (pirin superfamily)
MMGSAYCLRSAVKTFAETFYIEAHLKAGQRLALPSCEECAIYMAKGEVTSNDTPIEEFTMAILDQSEDFTVEATTDARLAFIGGEKLSKRFIDWSFVSSDKERIKKARADWKEGRFDKVPKDDEELTPLP